MTCSPQGVCFVGAHEQQVDVGARRERAAPVATHGDDRHALGRRRVLGSVDVGDDEVVEERG